MIPRVVVTVRVEQSAGQAAADAAQAAQTARTAEQAARAADQARANADRMIENAIQEAERAANASVPAIPAPPAPPAPPGVPTGFRFNTDQPFTFDFQNGAILLAQDGQTRVIPLREAIPREAAQIAWAIPATLSVLLIWWPLSRAVIRWLNRKHVVNTEAAALEARLRERMESMERNIDTVAVEMERLAEGQRFTSKLLAERAEKERVPVNAQH